MSENKELDAALLALETKHRTEDFLKLLGADDEAAKLIASAPDYAKRFTYDGVSLHFDKSDLPATDDPNAKAAFVEGPFKALFAKPITAEDQAKAFADKVASLDPTLLASARAGNMTAKSRLLRDSFNGDLKSLDAALTTNKTTDDDATNKSNGGHDKNGHGSNPFLKLRDKDGKIVTKVQDEIARMISVMGTAKVAAIARAVNMNISGLPLTR